MSNRYEEIIDLPHHVSQKHPRMSVSDRAAQFAPFSALTGYGATVEEVEPLTSARIELDESEKERIDDMLQYLYDNIDDRPKIKITYFIADEKKSGGEYCTVEGKIEKIDDYERTVSLSDGRIIPIEEIFALSVYGIGEFYDNGNS